MTSNRIRPAGSAAIYARVSTEAQAVQDKTSLDHQEKNARRAAERLGFTICEDYVVREAGSASDPDNRPGLAKLYEGAARGRFQYVVMDVVDRTTRAGEWDLSDICKRFLRHDVEPLWASDPEWDLTTPEGQHEASDAAWEAYRDKKRIMRRFNSGKMERIENGQLVRSFLCYGYKWDVPKPIFGVDDPRTSWIPDESGPADVVRRIFTTLAESWRTGGNASVKRVAYMLQDEGVPPPSAVKGHPHKKTRTPSQPPRWYHAIVAYIVTNETYKGVRAQNKTVRRPYTAEEQRVFKERTGHEHRAATKIVERPKSEWHYAKVPALVTEDVWEDANKQLDRNRLHNHRPPLRYSVEDALLFGGHVRCSLCGRSMQVWRPSEKRSWLYYCGQRDPHGSHPGRCNQMLVKEVDAFVWSEATRIIRDPEYLRSRLNQGKAEVWSPEARIAHYDELIAECDAQESALHGELAEMRGRSGLEGLRNRVYSDVERNSAKREEYAKKQESARLEIVRREQEQERLAAFQEKARKQADTLDDLTAQERRQILQDLHTSVFISRPDDTERPRLELAFFLTAETAAQVRGEGWKPGSVSTRRGEYITFVEQGWPPTPPDGGKPSTRINVDEPDETELEDNMSSHPAYFPEDSAVYRHSSRDSPSGIALSGGRELPGPRPVL
jgi:DNA invertase Pin-like site-specific DNA recombinase